MMNEMQPKAPDDRAAIARNPWFEVAPARVVRSEVRRILEAVPEETP